MLTLRWNPYLRLYSPELGGGEWLAIDAYSKKQWRLENIAALALSALVQPLPTGHWKKLLKVKLNLASEHIESLVQQLIGEGLVVSTDAAHTHELWKDWQASSCSGTAHYHFSTWDMPFLDYSSTGVGQETSLKLMNQYANKEADLDRFKQFSTPLTSKPLPMISGLCSKDFTPEHSSDFILENVAALTFGVVGKKRTQWRGEDLALRTSPSGGARHPSEGYLVFSDLSSTTIHHVNCGEHTIDTIPLKFSINWRALFHSSALKLDNDLSGLVVITSRWARNRFRYREPRTFRSVHMDAGHLLGTASSLLEQAGRTMSVSFQAIDKIEAALGLDPYEEAVQAIGVVHSVR